MMRASATSASAGVRPVPVAGGFPFVGTGLHVAGLVPVVLVGVPLITLAMTVVGVPPAELLALLARLDVPGLFGQSAILALGATICAMVFGVPLAWFVARTDLPGRRVVRFVAPLALAVPPYVLALAYVVLLAPGGVIHRGVATVLGMSTFQIGWPGFIFGTTGAAFVLGVAGVPTVFILVHSALSRTNPSIEDAARSLGLSPVATFRRVTLPLLRAPLLAGALLVFLYACVDFGVVSLLRARTVTTALYTYLLTGYAPPATATLALALVAVLWGLLVVQRRIQRSGAGSTRGGDGSRVGDAVLADTRGRAGSTPVSLGQWRWPAALGAFVIVSLGFALPIGVLAWLASTLGIAGLPTFWWSLVPHLGHTLVIGASGATVAVCLGLALALARGRTTLIEPATWAMQAGYALPGTILALAIVTFVLRVAPWAGDTAIPIIMASVILFAAPAFQACTAAIDAVPAVLVRASRGLGTSTWGAFRRVVMPLAGPALLASWALTFALVARELAATLLLRPPGYDTLAVRIWVHTMDVGPDPRAAAVALLLLMLLGTVWSVSLWLSGRSEASTRLADRRAQP